MPDGAETLPRPRVRNRLPIKRRPRQDRVRALVDFDTDTAETAEFRASMLTSVLVDGSGVICSPGSLNETLIHEVRNGVVAESAAAASSPIVSAFGDWPESLWKMDCTARRCLDVMGASIGLTLSIPFWVVLGIVTLLSRRGPLLFAHTRVGQGGREFRCWKFRTMVVEAESQKQSLHEFNQHDDRRTFKIQDDPRITPLGRWLRRLSIDEVPQLLNVLLGDMSLVGPRPPVPSEVALYTRQDWQRLRVKPGITCIWQVSGRSRLDFNEQLKLDLEYIRRQSIFTNVILLIRTVPAVLSCDGAW